MKHFAQDLSAVQGSAVYQRTDSGRAEIKNKSHGLTQSERLVLLMIDGVTSYEALCRKMTGVTSLRLERALLKLAQQGLVAEVLLSQLDPAPEVFDSDVIDLFLRQDALDPVTVISFEPEQEYESAPAPAERPTPQPAQVDLASWTVRPVGNLSGGLGVDPKDSCTPPSGDKPLAPEPAPPARRFDPPPPAGRGGLGWEYWFIGVGVLLLCLWVANRLFR